LVLFDILYGGNGKDSAVGCKHGWGFLVYRGNGLEEAFVPDGRVGGNGCASPDCAGEVLSVE
jgi:hypothetical protein